jgi:nucleotide-binding universal stress UspA family protein
MTSVRRILHATDFSSTSEAAWNETRRLGRLFDAEVVVVHSVAPPLVFPEEGYFSAQLYDDLVDDLRRSAQEGFDRLLASVTGSGLNVRIRLMDGPPAKRIIEAVTAESADLLVIGTHGRAGLQRALLGSVSDRLVRQAPCPVLTVPPTPGSRLRDEIHRICFATDFSPSSQAAWPWVVALAKAANAEVDLVHVMFEPVVDRHLSPDAISRMVKALEEQGRLEVERFLERSELPGDRIRVRLTHGVVGEQIVHHAREQAADLIVMGTHGWSGVVRWMLGSVANHVIQMAPCPVLTVTLAGVAEQSQARIQLQRGER